MPKLIINADDFGLTPGVNAGILYLFNNGFIQSTSIMANADYFDDALKMYSVNAMNVGVHLVITAGKPITEAKTLVDEKGNFLKQRIYSIGILSAERIQEIENEWDAQIQKVLNAGIKVTHLDVHHHMYSKYQSLHEVIFRLSRKYKLPIRIEHRYFKEIPEDIICPDYFVRDFDFALQNYGENPRALNNYLELLITKIAEYEVTELMAHPAFIDRILCQKSSLNTARMTTLDVLASKRFQDLLKEYNIELISYADLKK